MNIENDVIDNLAELERFLLSVEKGGLGLEGVAGVGMATSNADGRHFVAVFGDNHKLLLGRWVTPEVFEKGQEIVKNGVKSKHWLLTLFYFKKGAEIHFCPLFTIYYLA